MGTLVLHPVGRDLLIIGPRTCSNPRSMRPSPSRRRKRSPNGSARRPRNQSSAEEEIPPAKRLVMGEVRILKRGEALLLDPNNNSKENRLPSVDQEATSCGGHDGTVSDLYAGAACYPSPSPPPSSLPFPAALIKGGGGGGGDVVGGDDGCASAVAIDLRRLLRI